MSVFPEESVSDGTDQESDLAVSEFSHSHLSDSPVPAPEKKLCVVGLGYIGLPTASLLASRGYDVCGVDICEEVVNIINAGDIHIQEPELDVMVRSAVESKRLRAALQPASADIFILAVPTPFKGDYKPDLSYVERATRNIAPVLKRGDLVILESTSPVGTTEKVSEWLAEERPDLARDMVSSGNNGCPGVLVAHCPERVLPGQIIRELVENDRIVGGVDPASTEAAASFYKTFVSGEVLETDARTAEMSKLAENTFRDINIAYANELSMICDKLGIDVWDLIRLANHHPRVNILQPGSGVGGHCIAVDPWFIVSQTPDITHLIRTAREVNDYKPEYVFNQIRLKLDGRRTVACLGLSFKPNVDDLRESPALQIASRLADDPSLEILVVEPHITQVPSCLAERENVTLVSLQDAIHQADVIAVLVRHSEFHEAVPALTEFRTDLLDFVNAVGR